MAYKRETCCYFSGSIENVSSGASFHDKNQLRGVFTEEFGFKIIGDTFEHLKTMGCPQEVYGPKMKKLRDEGKFFEYRQNELLLTMSLRKVRQSDFMVTRASAEASGGYVSETVMGYLKGIPMLVIGGPHGEALLDNNSTFMIRMLTGGRYNINFNTEKEVINFVRKYLTIFNKRRGAIRQLITEIKKKNPHVNDRPRKMWDEFEGKTVIILGWPGAGKDTQAEYLRDGCGLKLFGSGRELRHFHSGFPDLKESLGEGNLAPSWVIINRITQKLIGLAKFEPIVFAGTPKVLIEAKILMSALNDLKRKPIVIVIDIDEELSRKRITLRRHCDSCDDSFCDKKYVESPICPRCNGPLTFRKENMSEGAIKKIFGWYKTDVKKVIRYFESLGLVTHIDGHRSEEIIFADILKILKR